MQPKFRVINGVVSDPEDWPDSNVAADRDIWLELKIDSDSDSIFTKFYNKESVSKAVSIQT